MGNVNISIDLVGAHHNRNHPADANRMAQKFVEELKTVGHSVTKATLTYGAADDLDTVDYAGRFDDGSNDPPEPPAPQTEAAAVEA